MPHIELSAELFQQIERNLSGSGSVDAFVREAVRSKLADASGRANEQPTKTVDAFDALCDKIVIAAPGTHLTRDQLHERN